MWSERTRAWSHDPRRVMFKTCRLLSATAKQRTRSVPYTGNRNSGSGQIRDKTCEAGRGPVAMAEPLTWAVGFWETVLLSGEALRPVQVQAGPLLGVGWARVCRLLVRRPRIPAFPEEGSEQGEEGRGPGRDPLHSLEVRLVLGFSFLLNVVLVGRAWEATGGARSQAGSSSFGWWSLPSWAAASGIFFGGRWQVPWQTEAGWDTLSTGHPLPPRSRCSGRVRTWVTLSLAAREWRSTCRFPLRGACVRCFQEEAVIWDPFIVSPLRKRENRSKTNYTAVVSEGKMTVLLESLPSGGPINRLSLSINGISLTKLVTLYLGRSIHLRNLDVNGLSTACGVWLVQVGGCVLMGALGPQALTAISSSFPSLSPQVSSGDGGSRSGSWPERHVFLCCW